MTQKLFKTTTVLATTETNNSLNPMNLLSKEVPDNHKIVITFHECFMYTILTIPLPNFCVSSFQDVCKFQHLKWHLHSSSACWCKIPLMYHA
jgi:hypothetical protein